MDTLPRAVAGACKIIGLVQEPRGSLSSLAEFAAHGGKFSFFIGKLFGNCGFRTAQLIAHAAWIAAEIPQDLHRQIRGIGAESPVFCEAKNAHIFLNFDIALPYVWRLNSYKV
jgi:hypothetical protein